ncbi:MAG: hypothetical protein KDA27_25520 [Candidatus Eisenbacteria bacterium]|uniref:Uncharacterized protein n=1 Tax=Eiseniibacteriota bacterium TaxID=2212470 RepID=A0A956NL81_UNCEI|nr:hypothetical protein [Candidatus Eisenbacteria bacterium]
MSAAVDSDIDSDAVAWLGWVITEDVASNSTAMMNLDTCPPHFQSAG